MNGGAVQLSTVTVLAAGRSLTVILLKGVRFTGGLMTDGFTTTTSLVFRRRNYLTAFRLSGTDGRNGGRRFLKGRF